MISLELNLNNSPYYFHPDNITDISNIPFLKLVCISFLFTGAGFASTSGDNPDLHLKKGQTYYFINNAGGSHPYRIQSTTGIGGTVYNDGVTNNAATTGAIIFHVQMDAPATLYYQCTAHAALNGTISIT